MKPFGKGNIVMESRSVKAGKKNKPKNESVESCLMRQLTSIAIDERYPPGISFDR